MATPAAQVYELERLRCGLSGTVFTAEPPAGVGETKYDETAAAMIALLKYGCGLPFHRIQRLEKALAIPLPAATQWEVVQQAAARLTPAFAELAEQAAEGSVLYNDDTTMSILNFTQEARSEALPPGARADRTGVFTSGLVAETAHGPMACLATSRAIIRLRRLPVFRMRGASKSTWPTAFPTKSPWSSRRCARSSAPTSRHGG